jgi:hypothetical protein
MIALNEAIIHHCSMDRDFSPVLQTGRWPAIVARYAEHRPAVVSDALGAVEALAITIAQSELSSVLFGWTSMFDLCIQQTDADPGSGPYLRISPSAADVVEFHYFDTPIQSRQWHREVPPEAVLPKFSAFLDQLGWIAWRPD